MVKIEEFQNKKRVERLLDIKCLFYIILIKFALCYKILNKNNDNFKHFYC